MNGILFVGDLKFKNEFAVKTLANIQNRGIEQLWTGRYKCQTKLPDILLF